MNRPSSNLINIPFLGPNVTYVTWAGSRASLSGLYMDTDILLFVYHPYNHDLKLYQIKYFTVLNKLLLYTDKLSNPKVAHLGLGYMIFNATFNYELLLVYKLVGTANDHIIKKTSFLFASFTRLINELHLYLRMYNYIK